MCRGLNINYLPFVVSFWNDKHPEVDQGQDNIEPENAEHIESFQSHPVRRDIEDDSQHYPAYEEEKQGNVQRKDVRCTKAVSYRRYYRGVKESAGEGFEGETELRLRAVCRRDGDMASLLLPPFFESLLRERPCITLP